MNFYVAQVNQINRLIDLYSAMARLEKQRKEIGYQAEALANEWNCTLGIKIINANETGTEVQVYQGIDKLAKLIYRKDLEFEKIDCDTADVGRVYFLDNLSTGRTIKFFQMITEAEKKELFGGDKE